MIRNSFIFLAFCFLPFSALLAQKEGTPAPLTDSLNIFKTDTSALITAKKINELSKLALDSDIDTAMISFHYYNPAYKESFAPQILGNTGSSFQNTVFDDRPSQSAFIFANPLLLYFHNPFKQQHYNTRRPFTEVSYISSGNKTTSEQVISALHTQNFNKYINIGVRYDLIASRGVYLNQEVKSNRFTLFGSYDKDNYSIYSSVSSNKTKALENGGLLDIPAFLLHQANDPIAYQMSLYDASSSLKNVSFFATQSYRFKKTVSDTSSVKSDSLKVTKEKDLPFMVNHTFRYDRFSRAYSDNESSIDSLSFYPNQYYNHNAAYDSAFRQVLENSFQISGDEYKFLPGFILGVKHQFTSYSYLYPRQRSIVEGETVRDTVLATSFSTNYNNLSPYAMLL